eukprot:scaffold8152_cov113-Isochrysis_galbana.AAC.5
MSTCSPLRGGGAEGSSDALKESAKYSYERREPPADEAWFSMSREGVGRAGLWAGGRGGVRPCTRGRADKACGG